MENSNPMFSSSSSPPKEEHDVFLSSGDDTRLNFTGHLREALHQNGFHTLFDDDELERGKEISPNLLKAIEDSDCSVVVLSDNYASSSWCLTELAKIVECKRTSGKILPIFYHVDPGHVRDQKGSYEEAFKKHEKHNPEKIQSWRDALKTVGIISGWHVTETTDEADFIIEFITQMSRKLEDASLNIFSQDLFGIDSRLKKFESSTVSPSADSIQFIGICGMGGIGKTTLARAYYSQNFYKFDGYSFLANVRETCEKGENGLLNLQTQLLSNILKGNMRIHSVIHGVDFIRSRLQHKKVLIVLDDVDQVAQLEALAFKKEWFGSGSIIIVTASDRSVPRAIGISSIYEVETLSSSETLQLFSQKAFKSSNPPENYKEMCDQMIEYANGLPLALEVLALELLGSFLRQKSMNQWVSALNILREEPEKKIHKVLKVTFDNLEEMERNIFLDIACFFNEYNKDHVVEILDCCGVFNTEKGISNLVHKSILSIDEHNKLHVRH